MCLINENGSPQPGISPPRSPWTKLLNRQISKPRLPRKVVSSAKVNLNKCWSKIGEFMTNSASKQESSYENDESMLITFSNYFYPIDPVKPAQTPEDNNAENENIQNGQRFELICDGEMEISENAANEIREICNESKKNTCFVCKICC